MTVTLKRFQSFDFAVGIGYLEVWINPAQVAYVQPRRVRDSLDDNLHSLDGTRIFFQQEAGVLDVKEPIGQVVALLSSGDKGVCRECYQVLGESWASLCEDCRTQRHHGVDADPDDREPIAEGDYRYYETPRLP